MTDGKDDKQSTYPLSSYLALWFGLLMLTGIIVTVSGLNLGPAGTFGVAVLTAFQSALITLFFIHAKKGYLIFKLLLAAAVFFQIVIMFFVVTS
ncbi:MAG: hypothetical protein MUF15_01200 [Acidobacteria bacterium]|jgi:hypothetical protein|nr:hypothetical protein [Acidobacteriota bacterium]